MQRNSTVDIIKALAIILMVYGHTFGYLRNYIYLFHMPVFFVVAGYCWKSKHSESIHEVEKYVFSRFKRLMLPYFLINFVFIVLHNTLVFIGVLSSEPGFIETMINSPATQDFSGTVGFKTTIFNLYRAMCFDYNDVFAGMTWFLYTLFFLNIIHCVLLWIFHSNKWTKALFYCMLWVVVIYISWEFSKGIGREWIKTRHVRIILCYIPYLLGIFIKKIDLLLKTSRLHRSRLKYLLLVVSFIISTVLLWRLGLCSQVELSRGIIKNPLYFIFGIVLGWILLYSFSYLLSNTHVSILLEYTGQHTMEILVLHTLAFKMVSILIVFIKGLPLYMIASFPIIFDVSEIIKWLYTIVGVIVPLLISIVVDKSKRSLNYKILSEQ